VLRRFYAGEFVMDVLVDMDHVNRALAEHGVEVWPSYDPELPWLLKPTSVRTHCFETGPLVSSHLLGPHFPDGHVWY